LDLGRFIAHSETTDFFNVKDQSSKTKIGNGQSEIGNDFCGKEEDM